MPATYPRPHAMVQLVFERIEDFFLLSYPIRDLPLHIRPAMVFAVATWLILLGVLGFAPLPELPLNDKALHFFGMGFAAFLIYFVFEVPEGPHRRVWYIRRAPLLLTLILAFLFGGIVSEFVQALLPVSIANIGASSASGDRGNVIIGVKCCYLWKTFQISDIFANLLGATVFLYIAHLLHMRARRRSEIADLYQPLPSHSYRDAQGRTHAFAPAPAGPRGAAAGAAAVAGTTAAGATSAAVELEDADGEGYAYDAPGARNDVWDDEIDDDHLAAGAASTTVFKLDDDDDIVQLRGAGE